MGNKKKMAAGIAAAVAALAIAVVLIFAMYNRPMTAADMLSLGERYLLEMQFEQALVQFLAVIEIEPNNVRAYLGAAEAFFGLGQIENAANILRQGLGQTGSEQIRLKLAELEGTVQAPSQDDNDEHAEIEQPADTAQPSNDVTVDESETETAVPSDGNLTGMPPMTFHEVAEFGLPFDVTLHDIIGRFGVTHEYASMQMEAFQRGHFGGDMQSLWIFYQDMILYEILMTLEYEMRIFGVDIIGLPDTDFASLNIEARQLLRFSLGMTLHDAIGSLAIHNPDILHIAENPINNALGTGEFFDGLVGTDPIFGHDGTQQMLTLIHFGDSIGVRIVLVNIGRYYELYLQFRNDVLYLMQLRIGL